MAERLAREQLARVARQLNGSAGSELPALILLTDDERLPDPIGASRKLPRGSLVIIRARTRGRRTMLANALRRLVRERSLKWVIADDPWVAADAGADGVHFPERTIALAARWRARRPHWLITCTAHSLQACGRAAHCGVDAILLAPVFATASHPGRSCLGGLRARFIARAVSTPIYALGGVDTHSAKKLAGARLAGLAAVGALGGEHQPSQSACGCAVLVTTV